MKHLLSLCFTGLMAITPVLTGQAAAHAAEPAVRLPASRLDTEKLQLLLDRQDVAGAIRLVEQGWQDQYEDYYQGQLTTQLLDADAISQRLTDLFRLTGKRSALVYVIPTPNHLELILVVPGARPLHRRVTAANRKALLQVVQSFRDGVMNPASTSSVYLPPAQRLYQMMIAPLQSSLSTNRIDTLIFCLGGGLRSAPVAALHDGKRFLIENYNLAIIPAFNLLDSRPVSLKGAKVLAMGAANLEERSPLPFVPLELNAIAKNIWSGEVLLNQNFTLAKLQASRAKQLYRIVHLATHADFAPGSIRDSYIQFWDQRLSPDRFQELRLRYPEVQLLVLSACRTAVGNAQAELGFAGLAVMSGSRAAIASLWQVSDVGTLILMTNFYRHLKTMNKTEALRQTQIDLLSKRATAANNTTLRRSKTALPANFSPRQKLDLSHPYYWAAFTVIGNAW